MNHTSYFTLLPMTVRAVVDAAVGYIEYCNRVLQYERVGIYLQ